MEKGTILLADNLPKALDTRAEFLQKAGYRVIKAASDAEALQHLENSWVHLAVLDIRLVEDNNPEDLSGLELAENPTFRAIPKIMMTGFPSYASVRDSLHPKPDGLPYAIDYLAKEEGLDALLVAVEAAFRNHVKIDRDLKIVWNPPIMASFPHLATIFDPAIDPSQLANRAAELEDLLRKLFYGTQQITLLRPVWQRAGRAALEAMAYYPTDTARFLVTCGLSEAIIPEFVRTQMGTLPGERSIRELVKAETRHYAALAWRFPSAHVETQTFERFFSENTERRVSAAIEQLFQQSLAPWHHQTPAPQAAKNLAQAYAESLDPRPQSFSSSELKPLIAQLSQAGLPHRLPQVSSTADQITYQFSNGRTLTFLNPCMLLEQGCEGGPSRYGMTVGSLELDTLLVSQDGQVWPTDFSHLGLAPAWQDHLALETAIRFNMIPSSDLLAVHDFEQELLSIDGLSGSIPLSNVELECKPALNAILTIRHQAAKLLGDDIRPYWTGLFFHTLQGFQPDQFLLRQPKKTILNLLHRLMLAGMLVEYIATPENPLDPAPRTTIGITIDEENQVVTVDGKEVHLTPIEFNLMLHLYRRAGHLCRREEIARAVFGEESASLDAIKGQLNTHMGRLRSKIEKEPQSPRYLHTVRGAGYKLVLDQN